MQTCVNHDNEKCLLNNFECDCDCCPIHNMKKKIINLTPHVLNIFDENDVLVESIKSSGVASVKTEKTPSKLELEIGYPTSVSKMTDVTGLPDPQEGVVYFVSAMVRAALPGRSDLISPASDRSLIVRDDQGRIQGIKAFDSNI